MKSAMQPGRRDIPQSAKALSPPAGTVVTAAALAPADRRFALGFFTIGRKLYALTALLVAGMAGMTLYTVSTLHKQKQDGGMVNLAGAQRMLIQKLSKDVMELRLGEARKTATVAEARERFEQVLRGLEQGDAALGLSPPETPAIREKLARVRERWDPFNRHVGLVLARWPEVLEKIQRVNRDSTILLGRAETLVERLSESMDAGTMAMAGRLRLTTQQLAKSVLSYAMTGGDEALAEGRHTLELHNAILRGLVHGDPIRKISRVELPAPQAGVEEFQRDWQAFQQEVEFVFAQGPLVGESLRFVGENNLPLLHDINEAVEAIAAHAQGKVMVMIRMEYVILALLALAGVVVSLWIIRRITVPLAETVRMIEDMGKGRLERRLHLDLRDEVGLLAHAMDRFADSLQRDVVVTLQKLADGDLTFKAMPYDELDTIGMALLKTGRELNGLMAGIHAAADQIAGGAAQVADASQSLSQGATESASSIEEITSSTSEITAQIRQNAENAGQTSRLATATHELAKEGDSLARELVAAMQEINQSSQNISKVLKVIDEIAFQTNLLALNAAVEAARAGQHGKGFAVVAEEVRGLAARSAKSAAETGEMISISVRRAENGAQVAGRAAASLGRILADVTRVAGLAEDIARASSEQAQGISQIDLGLGQIDQVTQQNTANAEEIAAAAEELSSQSDMLRRMLRRFRLQSDAGMQAN